MIYGRSDANLYRGGVRMGTSEFYRVVEALPEIADSLVIDTGHLSQDGRLTLYLVPATGREIDDDSAAPLHARCGVVTTARARQDPSSKGHPAHLSGKKLEVSVRKILQGTSPAAPADPHPLANPEVLSYFAPRPLPCPIPCTKLVETSHGEAPDRDAEACRASLRYRTDNSQLLPRGEEPDVVESSYVFEDTVRQLFRVNRHALSDPLIVDREWSAIFDKVWVYLCHESELPSPGDYITRTIARRPLLMTRDKGGELHALINSCLHRGAEVCRDLFGNSRSFRCFYHAWTYDLTGALVGVPGRTSYGPEFKTSELGLRPIPRLASYRGFVFGSFNPQIEDLEDYLGNAKEYIDLLVDQSESGLEIIQGTHKYSVDANWKLLVENSIDGYHLQPLHITYFEFLKGSGDDPGRSRRPTKAYDLGNGHALIVDNAPWGRPVARWVPSFGEAAREVIDERKRRLVELHGAERAQRIADDDINLFIFPNLVINDVMAVVVRTIWPVSAGRMDVSAWALGPKGDSEAVRSMTLRSFVSFLGPGGFATPDDMEALESCQRGYAAAGQVPWSDLSRGMNKESGHLSSDELQLRAFWRRWNEMMTTGQQNAMDEQHRERGVTRA